MARPRKYVQDDAGKTVDGLSFHRASGRYYSISDDGQRSYWGRDKTAAIRAFRASQAPPRRKPPMAEVEAVEKLVSETGLDEGSITPNLIELAKETRRAGFAPSEADSFVDANPGHSFAEWFKRVGFTAKPDRRTPRGSKERLSDCFTEWWSIMLEGSPRPSAYMRDVHRSWSRFTQAIGNKSVSLLSADDFATWRAWVTKETAKRQVTAKWHNDQHKYVKTVFRTVKSERPSWPFPDGLLEWQVLPKRIRMKTAYVPNASNKQPLPVDVFHAALAVAKTWMLDDGQFDTSTDSGRGQKRAAKGRRHRGLTADAMFRLAANCGLDNADVSAVTWDHIKNLDGDMPYLDMPRTKIRNRFRVEVDRKVPLLPSTVESLRRLRSQCPICDTIFRTVRGSPQSKNSVYDQFEDAIIEAKLDGRFPGGVKQNRQAKKREGSYKTKKATGWTFKHLRNIGGIKRHGISKEERDHFLGHVDPTQTRWYTGDADETYLIPLVNGMGSEYFGGEVVPESRTRALATTP